MADRSAGPPDPALHRVVWVYYFSRSGRLGLLHPAFQHCASMHIRVHRGACCWTRSGHLGVYFGDLSQPPPGGGPGAWKLHTLAVCRAADDVFSTNGLGFSSRVCVCVLLRNDGPATGLGDIYGSGNQRCAPGTDSGTPDRRGATDGLNLMGLIPGDLSVPFL